MAESDLCWIAPLDGIIWGGGQPGPRWQRAGHGGRFGLLLGGGGKFP